MRLNLDEDLPLGRPIAESDPLPPPDRAPPVAAGWIELLYRRHRHKLLQFVGRRGRADQAPDIVQHVFTRLTAQANGVAPAIDAPDAYLRQATRNLLRDEARAAERRSAHLHICLDDVPLTAPDQIAALEARDMLRRFEAAIARLEPRTREIFLAHRIDGYTYGEIALRTGLSVKTVEKHMSRAIAFLGRQVRV
jgi:RNA polymerase sigma-70 factor (ECF subfamily)